jgi:hypothetical protein
MDVRREIHGAFSFRHLDVFDRHGGQVMAFAAISLHVVYPLILLAVAVFAVVEE